MRCPFCSEFDTRVIDSRLISEGKQIKRRRECLKCGERFNTFESPELSLPRVIKRDGTVQSFELQKLRRSIESALQKRSISAEQLENLLQTIMHDLISFGERDVASRMIGDLVMKYLRRLDPVAYLRFASVYCSFKNVEAFNAEIEKLKLAQDT